MKKTTRNPKINATLNEYKLLIEKLKEGIAFVDSNEIFTISNPASDEIFGVENSGLIGRSIKEFTSDKNFKFVKKQTELRKMKISNTYELEIIRPDNKKRYIKVSVNPIFNKNNKYIGASSCFLDITKEKQNERVQKHINKVLLTIKNISMFISRESNIDRLLQKICDSITYVSGYKKVWIVLLDENKNVFTVNRAGKGIKFDLISHKYSKCIKKIFKKEGIHYLTDLISSKDKFATDVRNAKLLITKIKHNRLFYGLSIIQISDNLMVNKIEENLIRELFDNIAFELYNKELEKSLKKEFGKIRGYLDIADVILITLDNDGFIKTVNNKACEVFELEQNEIIGANLFEYFFFENGYKDKTFLDKDFSKKTAPNESVEHYIIATSGKKKLISWHNSPIKNNNNKIIGTLCIGVDITQQQKIKDQLSLLATVTEQASEMIIVTDLNGNIEFVNKIFENISGYNNYEVIGKNPKILKSGKQDANFYKDLWNTISNGNTWRGVIVNRKKNGDLYTEESAIFPIKTNTGKITNYVAVKHDISKEKELEDQLFQSQKLEAIGQLTSGMAHDFNNLLTVISGYAEIERSLCGKDSHSYKNLSTILQASNKASGLIKKLLAFIRKDIARPKVLQINDIINNMKDILRRLISEDIELIYLLDDNMPFIKADPAQIEQILINLTVNAMDAILANKNSNNKTITFRTSKRFVNKSLSKKDITKSKGSYILLSISDTGVGIPNTIIKKVFDPFFTTKEKGKGTGLGLSTIYRIVKQNKGSITINSSINKDTTFDIYWPVFNEKLVDNSIAKRDKDMKIEVVNGIGTILMIEDNDIVREIGNKILTTAGYDVISFSSGEEALEWFSDNLNNEIDLLFTDIVMEGMDGRKLVDNIRVLKPDIKVLYTSGYTDNYLTDEDISDNNISFTPKPYSLLDLTIKIKNILES